MNSLESFASYQRCAEDLADLQCPQDAPCSSWSELRQRSVPPDFTRWPKLEAPQVMQHLIAHMSSYFQYQSIVLCPNGLCAAIYGHGHPDGHELWTWLGHFTTLPEQGESLLREILINWMGRKALCNDLNKSGARNCRSCGQTA